MPPARNTDPLVGLGLAAVCLLVCALALLDARAKSLHEEVIDERAERARLERDLASAGEQIEHRVAQLDRVLEHLHEVTSDDEPDPPAAAAA